MIYINNKEFEIKHFPEGELMFNEMDKYVEKNDEKIVIKWLFNNNEELLVLLFLSKFFKNNKKDLFLPYIPYARMDRVKRSDLEIFTLQHFAELINSMKFDTVQILDPHSDVCMGLIKNVVDMSHERDLRIEKLFKELKVDYLFYPDNGCAKRLSHLKYPNMIGWKDRDWETGEIKSLKIIGSDIPKEPFDVLIVDDICSYGGTFYYSALELKKIGARNIYLYVSHCENSILDGQFNWYKLLFNGSVIQIANGTKNLMECGLIEHVYTTDSIFTKQHEKITIM